MENIYIFCDGGSRGNPGPSASAFVAVDGGDKVLMKQSLYNSINTNNFSEYTAVLMAVKWAVEYSNKVGPHSFVINLDSQLVERQLNGFYKTKNPILQKLKDEIKKIIYDSNLNIKFIWNYRAKNKIADDLVNQELDKNTDK